MSLPQWDFVYSSSTNDTEYVDFCLPLLEAAATSTQLQKLSESQMYCEELALMSEKYTTYLTASSEGPQYGVPGGYTPSTQYDRVDPWDRDPHFQYEQLPSVWPSDRFSLYYPEPTSKNDDQPANTWTTVDPRVFLLTRGQSVRTRASTSSDSTASRVTPTREACDQEGLSGSDYTMPDDSDDELDASDLVAAINPTTTATISVHPQHGAASGGMAATSADTRPFPIDRTGLFNLLQEGLRLECLMPSARVNTSRYSCQITCQAYHYLRKDGMWRLGRLCGEVLSSEAIYERHIRRAHLGAGSGNLQSWIRGHHFQIERTRHNPALMIQGARPWTPDVLRKDKVNGVKPGRRKPKGTKSKGRR